MNRFSLRCAQLVAKNTSKATTSSATFNMASKFTKTTTNNARSFSTSGSDIMAHFSDSKLEGKSIETAMLSLANADAVCFDVDSTVIQEEGIDVLADSLGKGAEVSAWTLKAMEGDTKFEDALAARLDIIKPSKSSILKCLEDHPLQLSPGVDRLVDRHRLPVISNS